MLDFHPKKEIQTFSLTQKATKENYIPKCLSQRGNLC